MSLGEAAIVRLPVVGDRLYEWALPRKNSLTGPAFSWKSPTIQTMVPGVDSQKPVMTSFIIHDADWQAGRAFGMLVRHGD